ncbi:energy transducer TonB [Flavobacterium lindanitolerans]|nr:energy transducer TonB [Flavobacterium lindanitolerans]
MKVFVYFVVEKDGTLTNIKVVRDPGYGLGAEAIRVLKSIKTKWKPGIQNDKPVRTAYNLPITVEIKIKFSS